MRIANRCLDPKSVFCLLLLICSSIKSQSSDAAHIRKIKEKVLNYYNSQEALCYNFEETRYSTLFKAALQSHAHVMSYRDQQGTYYKIAHTYIINGSNRDYEVIKNTSYFGFNAKSERSYKDFKSSKEPEKHYAFSYPEREILRPDTFLRSILYAPGYYSTLVVGPDHYRLQLTDSNRHERKMVDSYTTKRIKVFYISKKDHSIFKASRANFWITGDLHCSDSVIDVYTYCKTSLKETKAHVEQFEPFEIKPPRPEPPKDTVTVFPELKLPDGIGKMQTINSPYVLIDFWYKGCAPCLVNMKFLDTIVTKYKHIRVVTINVFDSVDTDIRTIMAKHDFTFLFKGRELMRYMNIQAFPTMYLIDDKRRVLYKHIGFGDTEKLVQMLNELGEK